MISNNGSTLYGSVFNDIRCLSTDEKPTDGIKNGSLLTEIDTSKQYLFDAVGKSWNEVVRSGGGEGSSYILPTMSASVKGGARLGNGLSINDDVLSVDVADEYVPFPIAPLSKYGTDGQVLRTNGDGSTQWQAPLIPTDQQAETYIGAWLNAHPEATTTVQDGSLTTTKYANNSITDDKLVQSGGVLDTVSNLNVAFDDFETQITESELITIPRTNNNGYYIDSSGAVVAASSNYQTTDPIDISTYNSLYITGRANYAHLIYAFYDSSNVFISGYKSNAGDSSTFIEDMLVTVPSNAKYIRISNTYNNTPYPNAKHVKYTIAGLDEVEAKADSAIAGMSEIAGEDSHQIDFIAEATFQTGYYNKSGAYYESSSYICSSKIPVIPGDNVYFIFHVSGNLGGFRFVTAYSDDIADSTKSAENVGTAGYTVPDGINYVRVSIYGNDTTSSLYDLHIRRTMSEITIKAQSERDNLFEKKWCVVGDSFSYGGQSPMPVFDDGWYKGSRKSYPYFIGNRTHINIIDFSANGRTLAYPADGSFSNSFTNPSNTNYFQNIPVDTDYITIYLGINDSHHAPGSSGGDGESNTGEIPIGTIDDATTATFGGAWNVALTWLITNRPNAHIGIIVSNGVDNVSYRNMTIAIAKKYGLAYLDLNGDERTPAMIRTVNPDISQAVKTALINKWAVEVGVNTHPNIDAHEYESYIIENFLRSI